MSHFTLNFLQHLKQKKADKGFTLIELLVVIIMLGVLTAISLPAFVNQANKARAAEAKQTLGIINRAQQAFRIEEPGGVYASDIASLDVGLTDVADAPYTTATYEYDAELPAAPNDSIWVLSTASARSQGAIADYVGNVSSRRSSVICQEDSAATPEGEAAQLSDISGNSANGVFATTTTELVGCPDGYTELN